MAVPDDAGSNAERSLAICSLFESEILLWMLLRHWDHPLAEDEDFRNELLETATAVLDAAAHGAPDAVFIQGMPASDMNLVAALWYAENRAIEDGGGTFCGHCNSRLQWLGAVRQALPSCFCPQDDLA